MQNEILPQLVSPCVVTVAAGRWQGGWQGPCRSTGPPPPPATQVYSLAEQSRFYKKAAAYCLRAVAKHSPQLAQVTALGGRRTGCWQAWLCGGAGCRASWSAAVTQGAGLADEALPAWLRTRRQQQGVRGG